MTHHGIGFLGLLAIVFIALKLGNVIAWSWWLVLAPLWVPAATVVVIGCGVIAFLLIVSAFSDRQP